MIYAFTGKKQSGKSTAVKYLLNKRPFTVLNFKDALIIELKERFPQLLNAIIDVMNITDYDGRPEKRWTFERLFTEKPPLIRGLMQNYGTDVRRNDDDAYWVTQWAKKAAEMDTDVIVDDVRFLNEAQAVRNLGGTIIRIVRSDLASTDDHISETEMDAIVADHTITVQTGDFETLYMLLDMIVEKPLTTSVYTSSSPTKLEG